MKKDSVITLENGKEYILLDSTIYEGKNYFFAVGYEKNENKATNEYKFFEEQNSNGEVYIQEVVDIELTKILLAHFTVNYGEMIKEDIEY